MCSSCTSAPTFVWKPDVESSSQSDSGVRVHVCMCVYVLRRSEQIRKCVWPPSAGARTLPRTVTVAGDRGHAQNPVGWTRVTRGSQFDDQTPAALAGKVELNYNH